MEPLLVPILGVWLLLNLAPIDLASGDAAESLLAQPGMHASSPPGDGDADADGVLDTLDACDGTPLGYPVLTNGCSSDTDSDGVSDGRDRCPETLPGSLDIDGAGCSQKDRKRDRPYRYTVGIA